MIANNFPQSSQGAGTLDKYIVPTITSRSKSVTYDSGIITNETLKTTNLLAGPWTATSVGDITSQDGKVRIYSTEASVVSGYDLINAVDGDTATTFNTSDGTVTIETPLIKITKMYINLKTTFVGKLQIYGVKEGKSYILHQTSVISNGSTFNGEIQLSGGYFSSYKITVTKDYSSSYYSWTPTNTFSDIKITEYYECNFIEREHVCSVSGSISSYEKGQIVRLQGGECQDTFLTKDWKKKTSSISNVNNIVTNGSIFVAATTSGVYTSSDGEAWTKNVSYNFANLFCYKGVFVGRVGTTVYTSTNGTTWTSSLTLVNAPYAMEISADDRLAIATFESKYRYLYYTSNGTTWTTAKESSAASSAFTASSYMSFYLSGTTLYFYDSGGGYSSGSLSSTSLSFNGGGADDGISATFHLQRNGSQLMKGSNHIWKGSGNDWSTVFTATSPNRINNLVFDEDLQQYVAICEDGIYTSFKGDSWEKDALGGKMETGSKFNAFCYNATLKKSILYAQSVSGMDNNYMIYESGYNTATSFYQPKIKVNGLAEKTIKGEMVSGQYYDLIYDGSAFEINTIKEERTETGSSGTKIFKFTLQDGEHIKVIHTKAVAAVNVYTLNGVYSFTPASDVFSVMEYFYSNGQMIVSGSSGVTLPTQRKCFPFSGNTFALQITLLTSTDIIKFYRY